MIEDAVIYYQGAPGAFSEAAILSHWPYAHPTGCASFAETFQAILEKPDGIGLLPIENAYRGPVYDVLDLLTASPLSIWAEAVQPVELVLMAHGHSDLARIRKVRSHPQALMQSQVFCRQHGLAAEVALDTAGSAREVAELERDDIGAIASPRAAEIYGLNVVRRGIQDHPDNRTRFWLLSRRPISLLSPLHRTKTSMVFDLPDKPGALVDYLMWYKKLGLNLSKVESRPRPGSPFAYRFWIDVVGDAERVDQAWENGLPSLEWGKRLGTYPVLSE
ncbi:MAG: prephenate dehydratase [Firmicutes bacterium]|jgi:prephenate dehydratase|nr:prephenate dehydratase [Bacillota bacterium]MCL5014536.1 prephenate dehydratase [Bacillota bacterium]